MTRQRWLAASLVAGWAVLLVVLAVWYAQAGPATVREQSDLASGRAALDAAVETIGAEVDQPGVEVEVRPYEVEVNCRLSLVWRGTDVTQQLLLTVEPGEEPALLAELAQRLPAQWEASYRPATGRLRADAGEFVKVVGVAESDPGQVRITVSTGCRPD